MDKEKDQLSVQVARMYYELEASQQEIADQLNLSRPTVSRLLKNAKDKGYVQIKIVDPFMNLTHLGTLLKEKYDLLDVQIAYAPDDTYPVIVDYISRAAATYIENNVTNGDILGVSWGTTLYEIARKLTPKQVKGVEVVQLKGGISHSSVSTHADETLQLFAEAFQTVGRPLPLPVIFDNPEVKKMVEADRHIHRIIQMGEQANIAVFTVGTVRDEALLFRLGYFDEEEKKDLKQRAVGDICSRFFDKNGQIANTKINDRTMGIALDALKEKEKSILVAGGKRKVQAISGALKGKEANILITDQFTAKKLLDSEA